MLAMSKPDDTKIAIISDLHFGVHGDSEKWHKIMLDYAKWLGNLLQERQLRHLFILGDVFDNRKAVGVETMQMAHDFFNTLFEFMGEIGLKITILAGNHDSFYEDTAKTSSVSRQNGDFKTNFAVGRGSIWLPTSRRPMSGAQHARCSAVRGERI